MARAGLGDEWSCLFANDFCEKKIKSYVANWGGEHVIHRDVGLLSITELPDRADLAWASFPCQDLSLAGNGRGIGERSQKGETRSGTFWPFWNLMEGLQEDGRAPRLIVLENVVGAITANNGADFRSLCQTLMEGGYRVGPLVLDAESFVPQSRPRLFIIAVYLGEVIPGNLLARKPDRYFHPAKLIDAKKAIPAHLQNLWLWWSLPKPYKRNVGFSNLIEAEPTGCEWHSPEQTERLLELMTPLHRQKIAQASASGERRVGGVYKRTRLDNQGNRQQRAEVRFDDVAGCLRTPRGGSSRQSILLVDGESTRSRLLSPREAARLMGLSDDYILPRNYNDAYHLVGDGVCVPVVGYLSQNLLLPLLRRGLDKEFSVAA
jgi:DNA (cytosine-5)-methyltransferase 1